MVYFLYGEDSFRALHFVQKILKGKKYKRMDFEECEIKDIVSQISSYSLFSSIVEEENFFIRGEKMSSLLQIPDAVINDENKIIIFYFEKITQDQLKKLPFGVKIKKFKSLKGASILKFIQDYLTDLKIKYDNEAINILSQYCGGDFWKMATEVAFIINKKGAKEILGQDIYYLAEYSLKQNAFAIIDKAFCRQQGKSLKILNDLIQKEKIDEFKIIGAINWQIKNILTIKELSLRNLSLSTIQKFTSLKYFIIKKSLEQSIPYNNLNSLLKLHFDLMKLYFNLKRLKISPQTLIEKFIYSLK